MEWLAHRLSACSPCSSSSTCRGTTTDTSARGNLLLTFEGRQANPTQALIAALQRRDGKGRSGITKDEEFYLSIMEPGVSICGSECWGEGDGR